MSPRIAVITPGPFPNLSPLLPSQAVGAVSDWEWYHRCLSAIGEVRYFQLREWSTVSGFDAVLVHEALEAFAPDLTLDSLARLRELNRRVVWVEPHQRSTFAASVFDPRFFDHVDRVAKYQLMDYAALVRGLRDPRSNLGPWALCGHSSITDFYADERLFGMPTSPETVRAHLDSDLSGRYGSRITPLMRLFTMPRPGTWYDGPPSRQPTILKEAEAGIALGEAASAPIRAVLRGLLAGVGLSVRAFRSPVRAAAVSQLCLAIGPVHLDGSAADVLRFDTLPLLPQDERYLVWDDVFAARESYLPLTGYGELVVEGGRVVDGDVARTMGERLAAELADEALCVRVCEGARAAHARLLDPAFVTARLGIEAVPISAPAPTVAPAAAATAAALAAPATVPTFTPAPAATASPIRVGGVATDEISVVVQGALSRDDLTEQVIRSVRRSLPGCEIVLSTWEGQRALDEPVDHRVESADPGATWQVHEEWPSNTGRLHVCTRAGLAACTRPYALKLRSDTPLSGRGFLEDFQAFGERGSALALLEDRIVVIDMYCWNPAHVPFGLFGIADTVQFGRTGDLAAVWGREPDDEFDNTTWFERHARPEPDPCPYACFRYAPEQLLWLGFLRSHLDVPFEHFADDTPATRLLTELALADNAVVVSPDRFGVELPKFAGRAPLAPDALVSHAMWRELYARYCLDGPNAMLESFVDALRPGSGRPMDRARRAELDDLAERARVTTDAVLADARAFVVLADAEELLADPALLVAYADTMGGVRPATLAIDASRLREPAAGDRIVELVDRAGLTERTDIDLVALVGVQPASQRRRILDRTAALYGRGMVGPGDTPAFTPESLGELRALAARG